MLFPLRCDGTLGREDLEPWEAKACGGHWVCVGKRPAVRCIASPLLPGVAWLGRPWESRVGQTPSTDAAGFLESSKNSSF